MKLLLVSSYFQPAWAWGGPVRSMWNLSRGLASSGVDVTVVCTNATQFGVVDVYGERTEDKVKIITCPVFAGGRWKQANRFGISVPFWLEIAHNVREADIVHVNGFWGAGPIASALACAAWGKPYVVSTRGNLQINAINDKWLKKTLAFYLGIKRILKKADAIHYTTKQEREWSPKWAREITSIIVPNAIETRKRADASVFRSKQGFKNDDVIIGSIGRIHRRKGLKTIAKALGKVKRNDIFWVIAGSDEGYAGELHRLLKEYSIEKQTRILGELNAEQLDQVYAGIDVLVLPAHGENFGNVVAEAAMQGTPSFVSNQLGLMGWIQENNAGIVLPLDDEKWAVEIAALSRQEIKRKWNSDRLSSLAQESFSIEAVANLMLSCYKKILYKYNRCC